MLNVAKLVPELSKLSEAASFKSARSAQQLSIALSVARTHNPSWELSILDINKSRAQHLTAHILSPEIVATAFSPGKSPPVYTALAVDGSQIPLDRHATLPYYLINIGHAVIHYGTGERPSLNSSPTLFYMENDLLRSGDNGEMSYITENQISQNRNGMEIGAMTDLIAQYSDLPNLLGLIDGALILWAQDPQNSRQHTAPAIREVCTLLTACQVNGSAIAGYVSRPGSRDVINALRIALATDRYGFTFEECLIDRVTDAELFWDLLNDGERSQLFESRSQILDSYKQGVNRIGFYYLHTGFEIARVEIPIFDGGTEQLVEKTHSLILDQVRKGSGYPIALTEAHEQAVVHSADRIAVNRLIENELIRSRIAISLTRKSVSKRTRPI